MSKFKLDKDFGPPKLREVHQKIVKAINERTPLQGLGISISEEKDGRKISTSEAVAEANEGIKTTGGTGSSGTASDIYGSLNGQPAVFHLSQTADPELVS